jgi:DNA-binding SARP family transcriptional activator
MAQIRQDLDTKREDGYSLDTEESLRERGTTMIKMDMLGPSQIWYRDKLLALTPLEKVICIALHVVGGTRGMTELAQDIWLTPSHASASTLSSCLSRSRHRVVAAGGTAEQLSRTIRRNGGRTLVRLGDDWDVDADRFQEGTAAARSAYDSGEYREARDRADATLKLWYADPMPDVGGRSFAIKYIEDLQALHWLLILTRIKAQVCLGCHREVTAELRQLTRDRPDEIEACMLLAIALYRSYLVPEAVQVCQQAIAARQELGIAARHLQVLQHAILNEQAPTRGPLGF